jgi:transketolase
MKNEVVDFLIKKNSEANQKFVFMTGDLGFSALEPLRDQLGKRFINVGVAESLMTTLAAAMASYEVKTFTYSIVPFATFRCLEQIRNDVCYHEKDVTIIGIGAGFGYGSLGPTHHGTEDLAAVWSLPNIRVYSPADVNEAYACFEHSWSQKGPKYWRLSKGGDGYLSHMPINNFKDQTVLEYASGTDLTIVSTGNILAEVLLAANSRSQKSIQILSCPILKPFPDLELASKVTSQKVLIVEELAKHGGFSGECAKVLLASTKLKVSQFEVISAKDQFSKTIGSAALQREICGLDDKSIGAKIDLMLGT